MWTWTRAKNEHAPFILLAAGCLAVSLLQDQLSDYCGILFCCQMFRLERVAAPRWQLLLTAELSGRESGRASCIACVLELPHQHIVDNAESTCIVLADSAIRGPKVMMIKHTADGMPVTALCSRNQSMQRSQAATMRCDAAHRAHVPCKTVLPAKMRVTRRDEAGGLHGASVPPSSQHRASLPQTLRATASGDAASTAKTFLDELRDLPPSQVSCSSASMCSCTNLLASVVKRRS